jgi:hypothetical protein
MGAMMQQWLEAPASSPSRHQAAEHLDNPFTKAFRT